MTTKRSNVSTTKEVHYVNEEGGMSKQIEVRVMREGQRAVGSSYCNGEHDNLTPAAFEVIVSNSQWQRTVSTYCVAHARDLHSALGAALAELEHEENEQDDDAVTMTREQDAERRRIIAENGTVKDDSTRSDVTFFKGLTREGVLALVKRGYIDRGANVNDSPTVAQFLDLMHDVPSMTAHGYVVARERSDARISLEGVEGKPSCEGDVERFRAFAREADDLVVSRKRCYAWWD